MRSYDTATAAYIAAGRAGIIAYPLVWITAKDRSTGDPETMGLWSGDQEREFTINAAPRTYHSAGSVLDVEDIQAEVGLNVRFLNVSLSAISDEVAQLVRGYDTRLAPVEVHRALFNLDTRALISEPHRIWKGWVNNVELPTPAIGGEAKLVMTLASSSRILTRTLSLKKSDESQRLRTDDRFRRHGDVTGRVGVYWGEEGPGNRASKGGKK